MESGFFGQSYEARSKWQEADRLINLYPEITDKQITAFIGCPGFHSYCSLGVSTPIRGMHATQTGGKMYVVSGDTVYKVVAGSPTVVGTLDTSSGAVCFASNGTQVMITDGTSGYVITISTDSLAKIVDADFPSGSVSCAFIATYFIAHFPDTDQWIISAQNDAAAWDALDFSSAELLGDPLLRLFDGGGSGNDLVLFGTKSTELFTLSFNATFPFTRVGNAFIEYGIIAPFSAAKIGGSVFWLGASLNGSVVVLAMTGYQFEIISTPAVNKAIQGYSSVSSAFGFCYQQEGHAFYILNFTTEGKCWAYDVTTKMWHERRGYANGDFAAYPLAANCFFEEKHLVGDYSTGLIYELSLDIDDYFGTPRKWLRSWTVPKVENKLVNYANFMLQAEVGTGINVDDTLYNAAIQRFDGRYWVVDFPIGSVATIVADTQADLTVTAEIRSNRHLVGLIWNSVDRYGHLTQAYETKYDCSGSVIGFCANARDPYDFNLTITLTDDVPHYYRMFPYFVSGSDLVCYAPDPIVTGAGTGKTYAIADVFPSGLSVPMGEYVYIIDFDDLRQGFDYSGSLIDSTIIKSFFISLVTGNYGLGSSALLADATAENLTAWHITGVLPELVLTAGDIITFGYTQGGTYKTVTETVTTWTGDGSTERYVTMANPLGVVTITGAKPLAVLLQADSPTGSEAVSFTMSNIEATGANSIIRRANHPQTAHTTLMTTGYDDTYNITPWRQLNQIYQLGYRTRLVCYMGASHYYKATSAFDTDGNYKVTVDIVSDPLNTPLLVWLDSFFSYLHTLGLEFTWSTSLEILSAHIPKDWEQMDYQGNRAVTGYTPTTGFIAPTNTQATTYITNVIKQGLSIMVGHSLAPDFQLGEFWWWDGTYSNFQPCFYDPTTVALYKTETGLDAPTTLHNIFQTTLTAEETAYAQWLGVQLGKMTHTIRDALIAAYPGSESTLLFFSPQIFNYAAPVLQITNFPVAYWAYSTGKWTKMQIEQYDWVILNQIEKYILTIQAATVDLGYPISVVHHFMGFVPVGDYQHVWAYINGEYDFIVAQGITHYYIWSYPQIIRDSMIIDAEGHFIPYADSLDSSPQCYLRVSNDAGNTWLPPIARPFGRTGEYSTVMRWQRLGRGRNRAYELSGTAAVKVALVNATMDAEVLS